MDSKFIEKEKIFLKENNLVKITDEIGVIIGEIPYATVDNFTNVKLYSHSFLYLHTDAYNNLLKAIKIADEKGYILKIFDCYRPFSVQAFMANNFPNFVADGYISHPSEGVATHVRGIAVDLTLVNKNDLSLVDMESGFDEMSEKSHHDSPNISPIAKKNRNILAYIMTQSGFEIYPDEWWHYNLKIFKYKNGKIVGALSRADKKYPKINENFIELINYE
ncbi:MAG: M15 family metallopeptidase [Alphaproteobacteria bacterium]